MPSLAYCALMESAGTFIVDDSRQYSRQSFPNRARLRTPDGVQWITVPLKGSQFGKSIRETEIDYSAQWVGKHLKAFRFNYGSTAFYAHYIPDLSAVLESKPPTLGALTIRLMGELHRLLRLSSRLVTSDAARSEQSADDENPTSGSGADISHHGRIPRADGSRILQLSARNRAEGSVDPNACLMSFFHPTYRQNFPGFESGLSVLDLLFNHGPDASHILRSGIREIVMPDGGRLTPTT